MKSAILRTILLSTIVAAASIVQFAQSSQTAWPGQIFAGESTTYEGKISRLRISISVAELTFSAAAKPNSNDLVIKIEAVSKGTLLKLFRFSFLQQYDSTVDLTDFQIQTTTKHDVQKSRVRDSEALFDYKEKRVTYTETDPKDKMKPPRRIASEISGHMNDMVSAIYFLRLQQLAIGKRFEFAVSDSGLVYKVPLVITAREQLKTVVGNVWCFRIEPEIFGTGRLIEQKGKMVIWMTDDSRHLPVRAQVNTEYGKIDIKLKSTSKSS
jgi:hypothetical protein